MAYVSRKQQKLFEEKKEMLNNTLAHILHTPTPPPPSGVDLKHRKEEPKKPEPIIMAPDQPFISPIYLADTWTNTLILQYFMEKLDLPQYYDIIKNLDIDGITFLSIHEELPLSGFTFTHNLHRTKVLAHTEKLREAVFKRVLKDRIPPSVKLPGGSKSKEKVKENKEAKPVIPPLEKWSVIEVATWLRKDKVRPPDSAVFRSFDSHSVLYRILLSLLLLR